jgi:hypothetical protein
MENLNFIGEGHYRDNNGKEYMSIWTYKIKNGIRTGDNYQEAKDIPCTDKFWGPFSKSPNFKEGWMYNVSDLNEFYNK